MNRKEIHFVIDRSGNIQSTVKGVKGSACTSISKKFEDLGQVIEQRQTGEYYETRDPVELSLDVRRQKGC